jgi:rhodanese-related sulfurtransferase
MAHGLIRAMATRMYARTAAITTTKVRQQRHQLQRCEATKARAYVAAAGAPLTNIDVKELAELLETADDEDTMFVDVREQDEWDAARVRRFQLKPLSEAATWLGDMPKDKKLIVMCKAGGRSMRACEALVAGGHENVYNVVGGITQYANEIGL